MIIGLGESNELGAGAVVGPSIFDTGNDSYRFKNSTCNQREGIIGKNQQDE